MLFAGWEVCIVKNCDRELENAARSRPHAEDNFQGRGHSVSPYRPTLKARLHGEFQPGLKFQPG